MLDADKGGPAQVPESKDQVIKPERVLVLSKSMRVRWRQLEAGLQGVKSLDDIMRIDLHYLSRCLPTDALSSVAQSWEKFSVSVE